LSHTTIVQKKNIHVNQAVSSPSSEDTQSIR